MEKFVIFKDYSKFVKRFSTKARSIEFNIRPVPSDVDPVTWVKDAITGIISKATEDLEPSDMVGFTFCSKDFKRGQGWTRFQEVSKISANDVFELIQGVFQSNSSGLDTDTFCLGVTSVRLPKGKGRGKRYNTYVEECVKRRGIISINNNDNLCLPRALVVAVANVNNDSSCKQIMRNKTLQKESAIKLVNDVDIHIPDEGCGLKEIRQFQGYLKDYKITIYQYGTKGRDVIYEGPDADKKINLLHYENHFNVITSLTAAFACAYYCEECHVPFEHKTKHRCKRTCAACQQTPPCQPKIKISCSECLRLFRGEECYGNHKKANSLEKSSVCEQIKLCPNCLKTIKGNRSHTCGEIFCKICLMHVPGDHNCYIQQDFGVPKLKDMLFIFYDLETRQEKKLEDGSFLHEPNLCVFRQCCHNCINEKNLHFCQMCGFRLRILEENIIFTFLNHILSMRKKFKSVIVMAHNGQAFDHQFILNHILTETDLKPDLIMRGTKIILMQLENVKFLDSLNYFPMTLSSLPKAFGLPDGFKKGYFPHLFNKRENESYVGPLPDIRYYSPGTMKEEARRTFLEWYEANKNNEFNFQRELKDYCVSDVEILTAACLKFREQMLNTTNVCPFTEACTIASACNKVFRRNFLKPKTIGVIPKNGYRCRDNQSKIALQWLIWEEHKQRINIRHSAKGPEVRVGGFKVDGWCPETQQVFEFHGCYFHGCRNCFTYNRDEPSHDNPAESLNSRYESTLMKSERLRKFNYEVIEIWECDFRKQLRENPEIAQYTLSHQLLSGEPLNPRDAFYGGRTGNCKSYYKTKEGEKIKYLDVCSLYPWVCKYGKFPVGHPEVFVGEECRNLDIQKTDGLIKCRVLPPQNLYHPVLPEKMNNKLMFVLCRSCGENMNKRECFHSDEQRALTGTWVIDEVKKAIEKGYKIMDIYEVWKYEVEQYNIDNKTGGLFVKMMDMFIKIKQQASGWPSDCVTEEQRNRYIEHFLNREGVKLEFKDITSNPGLRCLAKLMLNSFWGKLGQRERHPKTKIVNRPEEYFNLLTNPAIDINSILPINDNVLLVNYEFKEESYDSMPTVNVCIAAYTTAQARLKLYTYLEQLGERVLYYDTDSVIFSQKEGDYEPSIGAFIGDLTDELECYGVGAYINEFVSGGPKNYSYKIFSPETNEERVVCKVKGICLNYNTSQLVNFDSIKERVLNHNDNESESIMISSTNIRRTKHHEIVTKSEMKRYKPNSLKRKFLDKYDSVPYGFKTQKT